MLGVASMFLLDSTLNTNPTSHLQEVLFRVFDPNLGIKFSLEQKPPRSIIVIIIFTFPGSPGLYSPLGRCCEYSFTWVKLYLARVIL